MWSVVKSQIGVGPCLIQSVDVRYDCQGFDVVIEAWPWSVGRREMMGHAGVELTFYDNMNEPEYSASEWLPGAVAAAILDSST